LYLSYIERECPGVILKGVFFWQRFSPNQKKKRQGCDFNKIYAKVCTN
jgi:hypothetical protein